MRHATNTWTGEANCPDCQLTMKGNVQFNYSFTMQLGDEITTTIDCSLCRRKLPTTLRRVYEEPCPCCDQTVKSSQ